MRDLVALPKAELHIHLEGSMRVRTIRELAERRGVAPPSGLGADDVWRFNGPDHFIDQYGDVCNLLQENDAMCVANATGRCWTLPGNCPALPAGTMPSTRRCVGGGANSACASVCDLISAGRIFRVDDTCP